MLLKILSSAFTADMNKAGTTLERNLVKASRVVISLQIVCSSSLKPESMYFSRKDGDYKKVISIKRRRY